MDNSCSSTNIEDFFGTAHHAIQQAWEQCLKGIHSCDRQTISSRFDDFESRLRRQMKLEEEILFPALACEAEKLEGDPTVLMRSEHRQIAATLEELRARVKAGDCAALYGQHVGPSRLFRDHLAAEENVLYPVADLVIPAEKRAEILSRARVFDLGSY